MSGLTLQEWIDYVGIPIGVLVFLALLVVVARSPETVTYRIRVQLSRWWYDGGTRCPRCGEKELLEQLSVVRICWCCRMVEETHHDAAAWARPFRGPESKRLLVETERAV